MRVIVSIKATPGGGNASQATRYIAYRDRDEEREGKEPRKLFSAKEDALSFWQAERVLTAGRTPTKDEIAHLAVSFRPEDFQALGHSEAARQQALKEVTREAVAEIAGELKAESLTWVAGVHRNTDHPHLHLLLHKSYVDRESGLEQRINRFPEGALPSRMQDKSGVEKIRSGSFSQAFARALDSAQERAKMQPETARTISTSHVVASSSAEKEIATSTVERLLAAAQQNPSLAGRALTQEIILRGPEREPDERPQAIDFRTAFRTTSLDDSDYRTPPEQADWLGQQSQTMRDLYEHGAEVKGDILLIPAEAHELSEEREQMFITSLPYALERIGDPAQAKEFHTLAKMIAGETADPRTVMEVFRHYYAQTRANERYDSTVEDRAAEQASTLAKTLEEMRLLADEMAKLETRESIETVSQFVSLEETHEHFGDGHTMEFNTAARTVNLRDEALRWPAGLSVVAQEKLVTHSLPALDRLLESGKEKAALIAAIEGATYKPDLSDEERAERFKISGFLKAYLEERLRDPETRALNISAAFRSAHKQMIETTSSQELNRFAETFLRENLQRSEVLRLHKSEPAHHPKPDVLPLNARERNLLFFGRAPEHHTPEMRELRYTWGLSREERATRIRDLHEGRLQPSPTLERMINELDTRQTLPALKHYQANILNEQMTNPGKLDLHHLYERLAPHERTYLLERIAEKKEAFVRPQLATHKSAIENRRSSGEIPRESHAYREYMASMGTIEHRLLNEAVQQRQAAARGIVISKEEYQLSITEARSLLPAEEQRKIRQQARIQAWEQMTQPEVYVTNPEPSARQLSDTIAHLQENTQQRARLAHQVLDEFVKDKIGATASKEQINKATLTKLAPDDIHRWQALQDYAARTREELYQGFESLDAIRREIEQTRTVKESIAEKQEKHFEPDRTQEIAPFLASKTQEMPLANEQLDIPERNSTEWLSQGEPDRTAWVVNSDQQWHFDRLPAPQELAVKRESSSAPERNEVEHEFSYER